MTSKTANNTDINKLHSLKKTHIRYGRFIVFEGSDGAGKSTQVALLGEWLSRYNIDYYITREPGGTKLAENMRDILLNDKQSPLVETMLIFTARIDHIERVIVPNLSQGTWIICDRYIDSTLAYQGSGLNVDKIIIQWLHRNICNNIYPDLTITLDIDQDQQQQRKPIAGDVIETRDYQYKKRVSNEFAFLADIDPIYHLKLCANQSREVLHKEIYQRIEKQFLHQSLT